MRNPVTCCRETGMLFFQGAGSRMKLYGLAREINELLRSVLTAVGALQGGFMRCLVLLVNPDTNLA